MAQFLVPAGPFAIGQEFREPRRPRSGKGEADEAHSDANQLTRRRLPAAKAPADVATCTVNPVVVTVD